MSPTNARALNTMRQRLKKHNVAYQAQIDAFREKPESSEEEVASGAPSSPPSSEARSDWRSELAGCKI